MNGHIFFGNTQRPQQQNTNDNLTPKIKHNLVVMEICNNWDHAKDLFERINNGEVDLVDQMESIWIHFLSANKVDLNNFERMEEFEKTMYK